MVKRGRVMGFPPQAEQSQRQRKREAQRARVSVAKQELADFRVSTSLPARPHHEWEADMLLMEQCQYPVCQHQVRCPLSCWPRSCVLEVRLL
eukprot:4890743-Amphidinium_carterae.1